MPKVGPVQVGGLFLPSVKAVMLFRRFVEPEKTSKRKHNLIAVAEATHLEVRKSRVLVLGARFSFVMMVLNVVTPKSCCGYSPRLDFYLFFLMINRCV